MAGVKGRSGGARPGAGRKPKSPQEPAQAVAQGPAKAEAVPAVHGQDPLDFLLAVQNNPHAPLKDRIRAAVAAAQYKHTKLHDGGKKEAASGKASQAAVGRFSTPAAPPRLAVAGGKRVA